MLSLSVDKNSRCPYYTQLVEQVEAAIRAGTLREGDILPSMNTLAAEQGLSRETVKKAYAILVGRSLIEPRQGKGFYVRSKGQYLRVLILSDVHSVYKQTMLGALQEEISTSEHCDITVLMHNQDVNLLHYYLDRNLDAYDWYVVVPHFPLDAHCQKEVLHQLKRIPKRKLILLDRCLEDLPGHYGAVYQDFGEDAGAALRANAGAFEGKGRLNVICLESSMYKAPIMASLRRFAADFALDIVFSEGVPGTILPGDVCIVLSSQHDYGLVALERRIEEFGLETGRNVYIIGYNDFPLNELVLGGLSTLSTDFAQMGKTAAEMIRSACLAKVHNPFRLIRRSTF